MLLGNALVLHDKSSELLRVTLILPGTRVGCTQDDFDRAERARRHCIMQAIQAPLMLSAFSITSTRSRLDQLLVKPHHPTRHRLACRRVHCLRVAHAHRSY